MAEFAILRTQDQSWNVQKHSTHRTKQTTRKDDEVLSSYCLDCEVKFETGITFIIPKKGIHGTYTK